MIKEYELLAKQSECDLILGPSPVSLYACQNYSDRNQREYELSQKEDAEDRKMALYPRIRQIVYSTWKVFAIFLALLRPSKQSNLWNSLLIKYAGKPTTK